MCIGVHGGLDLRVPETPLDILSLARMSSEEKGREFLSSERELSARAGRAVAFERAQVNSVDQGPPIEHPRGTHLSAYISRMDGKPRTRQLDRNGDAARLFDHERALAPGRRSEFCVSAFPCLVRDASDPRDSRTRTRKGVASGAAR